MFYIPWRIDAKLIERFIFNFRLKPEAFSSQLPAPWLNPQIVNGWSVVSFCVLSLEDVTIWPMPGFLGFKTISCAYRCGALDTSINPTSPTVYITDRNTDLPIIARLAPFLLCDTIPVVQAQISRQNECIRIEARYHDKQKLFCAHVKPAKELASKVFGSVDEFVAFIKAGVSSYTPSIFGESLASVDLEKEDAIYSPLEASVDFSWLDGAWHDLGLEYDSATRATGGKYKWTFRGLKKALST